MLLKQLLGEKELLLGGKLVEPRDQALELLLGCVGLCLLLESNVLILTQVHDPFRLMVLLAEARLLATVAV